MDKIVLNKNQTKAIAKEIYGDIKSYRHANQSRYILWGINEMLKSRGK